MIVPEDKEDEKSKKELVAKNKEKPRDYKSKYN